jgi:small subunit ribosomal protein S9
MNPDTKTEVRTDGKTEAKSSRYIQTVGRRKTSIARVRITSASKHSVLVNEKDLDTYFPTAELRSIVMAPLSTAKLLEKFKVTVIVSGGGIHSQAEALRHGLSRALIIYDLDLRKTLKPQGFLKRDPRAKERRKFGFKKARKSPQWSKR